MRSLCAIKAALSGANTGPGLATSCATVPTGLPSTYNESLVTITTTAALGLRSERDCGIEMFLVFGRISTSAVCASRNTTNIVIMSMNGINAKWLAPCRRWRCRLMR